jgi:5-methyltetrahydropteroyltriglutamate--homocysteine methyltransferase
MTEKLLPTTVVGSYVQPEWLVDRANLKGRLPPRVRALEMWRVDPELLEDAQNDATLLAIRDMERAGIDIITDGEVRRESYSNRVATALGGIDIDNPGEAMDRTGHMNPVPRIAGKILRDRPIEVEDVKFLRANTDRQIKMTLPGPFTMTQQARPDIAKQYAVKAINRALEGIDGETAVHICFGYAHVVHERPEGYSFLPELNECTVKQVSIETGQSGIDLKILDTLPTKKIILGVLDLSTVEVETPEIVAGRIRRAFDHVSPERILVAPDCGMKYLRRDVAFSKLKAMCDGAAIVRAEL